MKQFFGGCDVGSTYTKAVILDENGKKSIPVATIHDGIGSFTVKPGSKPVQVAMTFQGKDYKFTLPQAQPKGYVLGAITRDRLEAVRESDAILREEIAAAGLDRDVNQYFTVLTNTRTVGVMGDERTHDFVLAIRAVTTDDFMTVDWARLPYELLARISARIVNEVPHVNRIVYDITTKPPATVEWE